MACEDERIVQEWLDHLGGLRVETKKMFGCYCLYCDGQAVGWIHDSVLSLREVGLSYLPDDIKRPAENDKIQELVIPLDYANAVWLPRAIQDTADFRKNRGSFLLVRKSSLKLMLVPGFREFESIFSYPLGTCKAALALGRGLFCI